MILRNFDNYLQYIVCGFRSVTLNETNWQASAPGVLKATDGTFCRPLDSQITVYNGQYGIFGAGTSNTDNDSAPVSNQITMLVSSDDAEESYDDYAFSHLNALSVVGYRDGSVKYTTDGCTITLTKTFINNTEEDITVNSVGIVCNAIFYVSSNTYKNVLWCREKLSAPITLAANGGKATFALTINIPLMNKPNE